LGSIIGGERVEVRWSSRHVYALLSALAARQLFMRKGTDREAPLSLLVICQVGKR